MNQKRLPEGWRKVRLGEITTTPESGRRPKGGVGGLEHGIPSIGVEHLNNEGGFDLSKLRYIPPSFYAKMQRGRIEVGDILIAKDGATTGKISLVPPDWPFDKSAVNEHLFILRPTKETLAEYLFFYLYSQVGQHEIKKNFHGSAQGGINQAFAEHVIVPLPPLPVQERIVEILQKADEIRRKRKEAMETVEAIRRSLFVEMFGDPGSNPKGWPTAPLNELLDPAIERVNPASAFPETEFRYIEIGGVKDLRIAEVKRLPAAKAPSRARQVVRAGDVLYSMTRPNLRKIAVVPEEYDGAICTTGFAVLRPRNSDDSAFVFEIVKSDHFTEAMSRLAQAKSLYPAVDESQVRQFQIIHPPAPVRAHFGWAIDKLFGVIPKAHTGTELGQAVFSSLLSRAFTGELTAEWEVANAEWIAQQQALYNRLPQLLILALLAEKAKRASRAASEVLVTALMKYVFLLQMEGSASHRRLYHFVPYHFGPFAKELYDDLKKLQHVGLVRVEADPEEEKTKITLANSARIEEELSALPDDLKQDVATIIDTYGDLDHNALLNAVYEKYPTYASKSRLKRKGRRSK